MHSLDKSCAVAGDGTRRDNSQPGEEEKMARNWAGTSYFGLRILDQWYIVKHSI